MLPRPLPGDEPADRSPGDEPAARLPGDEPADAGNDGSEEFHFASPAYEAFSRWVDDELARLVSQWEHLAAPAALRIGRISRLAGKK